MSGGGGGGWPDGPNDKCETLSGQTTLNSPNHDILGKLKKGELLEIRVARNGKAIVVQALYNGQVAGTITASLIQRLAECAEQGYQYVAEVMAVQGGSCKVHVRPR